MRKPMKTRRQQNNGRVHALSRLNRQGAGPPEWKGYAGGNEVSWQQGDPAVDACSTIGRF